MRFIKNLVIFSVCVAVVVTHYTTEVEIEEISSYQTVVFKDIYNTLIPIEVPIYSQEEKEVYIEMIEVMQSSDYIEQGLYPILNDSLEVLDITIDDTTVSLELNNSFVALDNEDALDIAESLSYSFCKGNIEEIKIVVEDQEIAYIPNSTIPVSAMNSSLGINNFETDTNALFKTIPVTVYNEQTIQNQSYYVPTTLRITCEQEDIDQQVQTILSKTDYPNLTLSGPTYIEDGILVVSIDANILYDNETMDEVVYLQVVESLKSVEGVEDVSIYIDGQIQEVTANVYTSIDNRIFY